MRHYFGPWATAIYTGSYPRLSTFWKRRMGLLCMIRNTNQLITRRELLVLGILGVLMLGLPTFQSLAEPVEKPVAEETKQQLPGRIVLYLHLDATDPARDLL